MLYWAAVCPLHGLLSKAEVKYKVVASHPCCLYVKQGSAVGCIADQTLPAHMCLQYMYCSRMLSTSHWNSTSPVVGEVLLYALQVIKLQVCHYACQVSALQRDCIDSYAAAVLHTCMVADCATAVTGALAAWHLQKPQQHHSPCRVEVSHAALPAQLPCPTQMVACLQVTARDAAVIATAQPITKDIADSLAHTAAIHSKSVARRR